MIFEPNSRPSFIDPLGGDLAEGRRRLKAQRRQHAVLASAAALSVLAGTLLYTQASGPDIDVETVDSVTEEVNLPDSDDGGVDDGESQDSTSGDPTLEDKPDVVIELPIEDSDSSGAELSNEESDLFTEDSGVQDKEEAAQEDTAPVLPAAELDVTEPVDEQTDQEEQADQSEPTDEEAAETTTTTTTSPSTSQPPADELPVDEQSSPASSPIDFSVSVDPAEVVTTRDFPPHPETTEVTMRIDADRCVVAEVTSYLAKRPDDVEKYVTDSCATNHVITLEGMRIAGYKARVKVIGEAGESRVTTKAFDVSPSFAPADCTKSVTFVVAAGETTQLQLAPALTDERCSGATWFIERPSDRYPTDPDWHPGLTLEPNGLITANLNGPARSIDVTAWFDNETSREGVGHYITVIVVEDDDDPRVECRARVTPANASDNVIEVDVVIGTTEQLTITPNEGCTDFSWRVKDELPGTRIENNTLFVEGIGEPREELTEFYYRYAGYGVGYKLLLRYHAP